MNIVTCLKLFTCTESLKVPLKTARPACMFAAKPVCLPRIWLLQEHIISFIRRKITWNQRDTTINCSWVYSIVIFECSRGSVFLQLSLSRPSDVCPLLISILTGCCMLIWSFCRLRLVPSNEVLLKCLKAY